MEKNNNKGKQVMIVNYKDNHDGGSSSRQKYPPGYRFIPTDRELILDYLAKKVNNEPIPVEEISEVNLYEHSPEYLAVNYPYLGFEDWYFFTPRDRKYPKGNRPKRSVGEIGFWKATGSDKPITSAEGAEVGFKKTLVFHVMQGELPNERKKVKTDWTMHEFRLNAPSRSPNSIDMKLDDWVLCRIRYKNVKTCTTQLDVEEDDNVAQLHVRNNVVESQAVQAEPLNIIHNNNNNNNNGAINENYIGPFVDNNNLYNAGAIRQNHVDHGSSELNSGYPGQQYPSTSNYYTGQVPLPDMNSHIQNPPVHDETPYEVMCDLLGLSGNGLYDFPCLIGNCFMQFDDPWSAPAADHDKESSQSKTKSSDGTTDDQHMGLNEKKF